MAGTELPSSPYKRILFCTDFSENADFSFDYAIDAAVRRPDCLIYLLHVIPEPEAQFWKTYLYELDDDIDEKARKDIDARITESYLPRVPEGVNLEVHVCMGKEYIKILEFAEENDVDLIIMGRQGRGTWGTVLFGNVTEKVTRKANCAVLVVPLSYEKKRKSPK